MRRMMTHVLIVAGAMLIVAGCGGDMGKRLASDPAMQAVAMDVFASDVGLASRMVEKLVGNDSTRTVVVDKILSDGAASREVMSRIAADQTMVDGVLNLAVQDTVMRSHIMGVLQGMKMMAK